MRMGQSSKDFPLQEERPDLPVTGTRNKDYIAPTADRIQRHFAASFVHKTVTNGFLKLWTRQGHRLGTSLINVKESVLK
jgi:hypothetical protein